MLDSTFCVSYAIRMRFTFLLTPHQRHLDDTFATIDVSGTNITRQTGESPSYSLTCFHTHRHVNTCASWQWCDYHQRKVDISRKRAAKHHTASDIGCTAVRRHERKPSYAKNYSQIDVSNEKQRERTTKTNRTDCNKYKTNRSVIVSNVRREQINFGRCVHNILSFSCVSHSFVKWYARHRPARVSLTECIDHEKNQQQHQP